MTRNIAKIRAALESALARATSGSRVAELRDAIVALAELEKAAAEPVAWMYDKGDEEGLVTPFNPLTTPGHGGRKNIRPLYAAPPAPIAEIREPTPEECERIEEEYARNERRVYTRRGRDMADAVIAIMWPKSEAK